MVAFPGFVEALEVFSQLIPFLPWMVLMICVEVMVSGFQLTCAVEKFCDDHVDD